MKPFYLIIILSLFTTPCFSQVDTTSMLADTTLASHYIKQAKTFAQKAQFDSSNFYYEKANAIYEQICQHFSIPRLWKNYVSALTHTALNFFKQGDYQRSLERLQKGLAIGLEHVGENHEAVIQVYNILGMVYYSKADYARALDYYNLALAKTMGLFGSEHPQTADSYNHLATIYGSKGDYQKALDYFQHANAIFRRHFGENHVQVACSYHNLGMIYRKMADYDRALDFFHKSLAIDLKLSGERSPDVAMGYNRIGTIYGTIGDYDWAFEYLQKSLSICLAVFGEKHPQVASNYNDLGVAYQKKGDYSQALEFFNKSIAVTAQTVGENHPKLAIGYGNLGVIYRELGNYDQAIEYHQKALAIHLISLPENHDFAANCYRNLGVAYHLKGDDEKAIENYHKSLAIQQKLCGAKHSLVADMHQLFGELYLEDNNFQQALRHSQQAIIALTPDFSDTNIYSNPPLAALRLEEQAIFALNLKANALQRYYSAVSSDLNDLEMAFQTYQLTSDLINRVRHRYQAEGSKIFLEEKTSKIFAAAIRTALQLYDLTQNCDNREKAFLFAEKAKAMVLQAALQDARARRFANLPDSLLEQERQLKIDLAWHDSQLQKELQKKADQDSVMIKEFQARLFRLNSEYQQFVEQLEKNFPKYYKLKYQTPSISIAELQGSLPPDAALIEYLIGEAMIYIFVITRDNFDVVSVTQDANFASAVESLARSIKKAEIANFVVTSHQLYLRLIQPIEHLLTSKSRLIVIPDGILYRIPFETLLASEPESKVDLTRFDYLIKRFEISYHYSATLYLNTPKEASEEQERFLAGAFIGFAPVFNKDKRNGYILASNLPALTLAEAGSDARTIHLDEKRIHELPHSEREVIKIIKGFEASGKTALGYFHSDASEENFKRESSQYQIVHIATHGIINEERPQLSGIVFSQPQDSVFSDDGILYAGEAYNLNLQADLLVLSSCESGLGKLVPGEGMMALTRGFFYSGASNIIVSLWKVSDKYTSQLMIDFYTNILNGKDYAAAIRETKINLIKNPATALPKIWGGFVLVGR
ncbi:MAG: CHAT domain-containing protein [candidate division KSB1 bacterium]|nr:CHAT domain-containing protein [candidate division KSB1 bacterium]MDZ7342160.1 CHAT domain-containing protein [candidate division KSB1 bacterium]